MESVDFKEYDIIPDDPLAFALIRKIQLKWKGKYIGDVAWARKPFGLESNHFQKNKDLDESNSNRVPCLSLGKKIKYVARDNIIKNKEKIDLWKVSVPKAVGGTSGNRKCTSIPVNQIFLLDKGMVSTETYSIIDVFNNKDEAEHLVSFLKTNFARYLVGLRKVTQNLSRNCWNWVPYMDVNQQWTDEDLFDYFNITPEEQTHIKNKADGWS